MLHFTMISLML